MPCPLTPHWKANATSNYRNLRVEQLGSIYERLLERELVQKEGGIDVRLNVFARKGVGQLLHAGRAREPDYQRDHRPTRRGAQCRTDIGLEDLRPGHGVWTLSDQPSRLS